MTRATIAIDRGSFPRFSRDNIVPPSDLDNLHHFNKGNLRDLVSGVDFPVSYIDIHFTI